MLFSSILDPLLPATNEIEVRIQDEPGVVSMLEVLRLGLKYCPP